jgi:hypothetical protein
LRGISPTANPHPSQAVFNPPLYLSYLFVISGGIFFIFFTGSVHNGDWRFALLSGIVGTILILFGIIALRRAHHWIKLARPVGGPTPFTQLKECIDYNDVDDAEEP